MHLLLLVSDGHDSVKMWLFLAAHAAILSGRENALDPGGGQRYLILT
ncbi:MAG: hypothetical protein AAFV19_02550 [Pseudomonadota bacterium]